jgi:hypothetical protein
MTTMLLLSIAAAVAAFVLVAVTAGVVLQRSGRLLRSAQLMPATPPRAEQRRRPRFGRRDYSTLL